MAAYCEAWMERFNVLLLQWAKEKFAEEVRLGFPRLGIFDCPRNVEIINALRRQPANNLKILSQVLPSVGWVLSDLPAIRKLQSELPLEEKLVVDRFREELDKEFREHFNERIAYRSRARDEKIKGQFNLAAKLGNKLQKEIARKWGCNPARAGKGEWGFIFHKDWRRIVISFQLAKHMELDYWVSVSDAKTFRTVRNFDSYGGVLNIGVGEWDVSSTDPFPDKFLMASEFARWHVEEYEQLAEKVSSETQ